MDLGEFMEFPIDNSIAQPDGEAPFVKPDKRHNASFKSTSATGVVLDNWRAAKVKLDAAKKEESDARDLVVNHVSNDVNEGVNRFSTDKFVLKVTRSPRYKVDGSNREMLGQCLNAIYQMCGGNVANNLIKWQPTLDKRTYDELPQEAKDLINPFLTLTFTDTFGVEEND